MTNGPFPILFESADAAADFVSVFSNNNRLKMLCVLLHNELSVNSIAAAIGLAQSAVSQHLMVLHNLDLVSKRRQAQQTFYKVSSPHVELMLSTLSGIHIGSTAFVDSQAGGVP